MRDATVRTGKSKHQQLIEIGPHRLIADEPTDVGGDDAGPSPHDFLLAALGSCTSMTLKIYADRKGWPLERVSVHLTQEKEGDAHVMHRTIELGGPLDDEQRARLLEIANKCPVHKTLTGTIRIVSDLGKVT
jgi:putative redox protein